MNVKKNILFFFLFQFVVNHSLLAMDIRSATPPVDIPNDMLLLMYKIRVQEDEERLEKQAVELRRKWQNGGGSSSSVTNDDQNNGDQNNTESESDSESDDDIFPMD